MEGHGREEVVAGVDLTRTVGWFTSLYPVVLRTEAGEERSDGAEASEGAVAAVCRSGALVMEC